MKVEDLKGKKITVMGLGLNGGGVGTVRFLLSFGAKVIVTDMKTKEELAPSLEKLKGFKNVTYVFNQHRPEDFTKVDMVIKNPAASWNNKYIQMALENGVPVEMDSSLFFKLCKVPIIGITGTKGKTTTSTLIYEIFKEAGKNVIKVGIGQTSVLDKLKEITKDSLVVFELSSWRLSALGRYKLSPHISVVTNIYPDHLNYYRSMKEYIQDKKYIFLNQKEKDILILNWDNETTRDFQKETKAKVIWFSNNSILDFPAVYVKEGNIYFKNSEEERKILAISDIKMKGEHNVTNALAAIAASLSLCIKEEVIRKSVSRFSGVNHRLELVRELHGVKYYNDTAATTPESGISGINAFREPIILICGGADKKLDVSKFGEEICRKAKGVIFLKGAATDKLIVSIKNNYPEKTDFRVVESMAKAVELASQEAVSGDVVLLSPGASSFGLFKNEFDRGDKFNEGVRALK